MDATSQLAKKRAPHVLAKTSIFEIHAIKNPQNHNKPYNNLLITY